MKERNSKKKKTDKISPKDYERFTHGPFKIERIGRVVRMSSHWETEQFEEFKEKVKSKRPTLKDAINNKIGEAISLIQQVEPLELLSSVSLKNCFVDPEEYKEATHEGRECLFEYAQSLVLSQPRQEGLPHATEEVLDKFDSLLADIFNDIYWYFGSEVIEGKRKEFEEKLRFTSILRYLLARGDSFQEHHVEMIRDIFRSHDIFFEQHYGFSSGQVISGIQEIEEQLLNNLKQQTELMSLLHELHDLFKELIDKEELDSSSSIDDCLKQYRSLPIVQEKTKKLDETYHAIDRNPFEITPTKSASLTLLKC